jgi:hypothetical protein
MEGKNFANTETAETRDQKIESAERTVVSTFETRIREALDKIANNPYFRELEQTR